MESWESFFTSVDALLADFESDHHVFSHDYVQRVQSASTVLNFLIVEGHNLNSETMRVLQTIHDALKQILNISPVLVPDDDHTDASTTVLAARCRVHTGNRGQPPIFVNKEQASTICG